MSHEENPEHDVQFEGGDEEEFINPEDVEYVDEEEEGGDMPMDEDDEDEEDGEMREPPEDNSLGHSGELSVE